MNDNETIVTTAETTAPQDLSEETAAPETHEGATTPEGESAAAATADGDGEGTIPAETTDGTAAVRGASAPQRSSAAPNLDPPDEEDGGITYRYNHRTYRASADEVQQLLMRGRRFETVAPQLDRLHRVAQARGQGLDDLIAEIEQSHERREIEKLAEKTGGNQEMARQLYDLQKQQAGTKYKSTMQTVEEQEQAEREEETARMGRELSALSAEFPEIKEFKDVPRAVVANALKEDISLLDAYLRWQHKNGKAAAASIAAQQKAAASAAGSMASEPENKPAVDPQAAAFLAAFRNS